MTIAIIFAGGSGTRMGTGIPKQFLEVNGSPIIVHTMKLFQQHNQINKIYISTLAECVCHTQQLVDEYNLTKVAGVIPGGETAQDSIYLALQKAADENPSDSIVLLHDGVRPFLSQDVITDNIRSVQIYGNAITCTPCFETVLLSANGETADHVPMRKAAYSAQAPQSFRLQDIINIHRRIRATENGYTNMVDACTMCTSLNIPVHLVQGNRGNIKVTTPEDLYFFRALLNFKENQQLFGISQTNFTRSNLAPDAL